MDLAVPRPVAADEDATDPGVDGIEDQRGLHRLLPDQCRERHERTRVRHRTHCASGAEHRDLLQSLDAPPTPRPPRAELARRCAGRGRHRTLRPRSSPRPSRGSRVSRCASSVPASAGVEQSPARPGSSAPSRLGHPGRDGASTRTSSTGIGGEPVTGFPDGPSGRDHPRPRDVAPSHRLPVQAPPLHRLYGNRSSASLIRRCAAVIAVEAGRPATRRSSTLRRRPGPSPRGARSGVSTVFSGRPEASRCPGRGGGRPRGDRSCSGWGSLRSRDPRKGLDTLLEAMEEAWRQRASARHGRGARTRKADRVAVGCLAPPCPARAVRRRRRHRPRLALPSRLRRGDPRRPMKASG